MSSKPAPNFLWNLFQQLRRRNFSLGPEDYEALQQALRSGFGWSSSEALRDLCVLLWAKSKREQKILIALFNQSDLSRWELPRLEQRSSLSSSYDANQENASTDEAEEQPDDPGDEDNEIETEEPIPSTEQLPEAGKFNPTVVEQGGLPPISPDEIKLPTYPFIFLPQFPLTYREVAQAWRRLRRPIREGPAIELDIEATIDTYSRRGIFSDIVLVPRRRNMARLLLLVDRQGSMTPFHHFVDDVCLAIRQSGNLEDIATYYFHDVPAEGADEKVLDMIADQMFPILDPILSAIKPLGQGVVYSQSDLLSPVDLDNTLENQANDAAVVLISDGGAARSRYDPLRLLDTIAFFKALRVYTKQYVWLNPLPYDDWRGSTAAQIARHIPMFPLTRIGMHQAVNTLRGHPYTLDRPL